MTTAVSVLSFAAVHLSSQARVGIIAGAVAWLLGSFLVALYGHTRGYAWFPLFLVGVVPGFLPVVLLVVTVAPDRKRGL